MGSRLRRRPLAVPCPPLSYSETALGRERVPLDRFDGAAVELFRRYLDRDVDIEMREAALNDPAMPDSLILALLDGLPRLGNRRAALIGFCGRPAVLAELARSELADDRKLVAFNPTTPADVLRTLARDPDAVVRANVAYNPNAERDVLALLMADPADDVRYAVADALGSELGQFFRQGNRTAYVEEDEGEAGA